MQQGRCRSRSPLGAAQKRGHDVHAASPSTGSLVLAFLGQQSCLSLALAVVLQPHCTAYPFLKSTPHKYFVKHLLANVLVLIIFFFFPGCLEGMLTLPPLSGLRLLPLSCTRLLL